VVVEVSGGGSVELSLDDEASVVRLAPEEATQGPYDYAVLSAPLAARGVHDLRVRLRGPLRLARIGFTA
jgi:beta-glucosidase